MKTREGIVQGRFKISNLVTGSTLSWFSKIMKYLYWE